MWVAVHMRATPQGAGLKREVLVDRHTPVVCRHDRHTGRARREGHAVREVFNIDELRDVLVLVALVHSLIRVVLVILVVDMSLQRL